jgi:hypothetical protein
LLDLIMPFAPQMSFSRLAEPAGSPATTCTAPTSETRGPLPVTALKISVGRERKWSQYDGYKTTRRSAEWSRTYPAAGSFGPARNQILKETIPEGVFSERRPE